jgi:hypothetical protein
MDRAGDHADPGHASHAAACPPPPSTTSLRSDTADAGTHGHRTPTLDTGHRSPDTWTLRPTPDTGHRSPGQARVDSGRSHRTLDAGRWVEDADTVTKARLASAPPGPRPAAARWANKPCSCGQLLRRLATMTARRRAPCQSGTASSHYQPAARSLRRRPSGAWAHCCPRMISGRA